MGLQVYDEHIVQNNTTIVVTGDGTTDMFLWGPYKNSGGLNHVLVSSTAAAAHDVSIKLGEGATVTLLTVSIPAGAGNAVGVPMVDALAALPSNVDRLILDANETLYVALAVALSSGETMTFFARGGMF